MNGIHTAFTGHIGRDAEVAYRPRRQALGILPDGEAPATWVRVALFGDAVGTVVPRLTKGTGEGRITLRTWTGRDGEPKRGSNLAAWEVQPMGQTGGGTQGG